MSNSQQFDNVFEYCRDYTKDDSYVYNLSIDFSNLTDRGKKWLVIMKKLESTKTNEDDENIIEPENAQFVANELLVVKIVNIYNPRSRQKKRTVNYKYGNNYIKYRVGKIARSEKFDKVNKQYFSDVRYFKTITPAFYHRKIPHNYTGKWLTYYKNGRIKNECNFVNGERRGRWMTWTKDGEKVVDYDYDTHPHSTCSCVIC